MKVFERVPKTIDIPTGFEIELEPFEELYYKPAPFCRDGDQWVHLAATSFRVVKEGSNK